VAGFWASETIRERVENEKLVVPFAAGRVVNGAYELSLGPEVYVTSAETGTKRTIRSDEQVVIPPGQFANLLTEEVVTVPRDALGLISVKFRLKQRGLVNVSGFHVDPGYSSQLVFSVYNAGPSPVVLARGDPAFLLWYASFDRPTDDLYRGGRIGGISAEEVMHLQGEISTPQALAARVQDFEQTVEERLRQVDERLDRWANRLTSVWSTVWKAAVGVAVAALLAWAAGLFDGDDSSNDESPQGSTSTLTSLPSSTATAASVVTTAVP
jgi:dCTP deaminase